MGRKEIRQKHLLQVILDRGGIPSSKELATIFKVSERTIQYDLAEITETIPDVAVEDIRRILMLRLRKRVPEMKDRDLLKLAEFFLSKKTEVKGEVDATIVIKAWDLGKVDAKGVRD